MREFKFFDKNDNPTITQLLNYNRRIKNAYIYMLNLSEGNDEHTAVIFISDMTIDFINNGQLTSYNEIRSYYHVSFENMAVNIYGNVITDTEHEFLISEQTLEEQIAELSREICRNPIVFPLNNLMGEVIDGIRELNNHIRINS